MAARSKQDRRKKTVPAQKSASQIEEMPKSAQDSAPQARELVSSQTAPAGSRQTPAARHGGTARKSTVYLAVVLCLLMGIYLGTLLPSLRGSQDIAQHDQPQQAPVPAEQGTDKNGHLKGLEETVRKNPQDLHAWIQLGNQYFDGNKPRDAIRAYERALSINADNPDVLTDLGIMYRQIGEFERAAERFAQAGKVNPLHEQSRFNLGVVLFFDLNRKDEARKAWRSLLSINPEAKTPDGALLRIMLDELK